MSDLSGRLSIATEREADECFDRTQELHQGSPPRREGRAGGAATEPREWTMASYEKTGTPGIFRRGETYSVAYRHPITRKTTFKVAGRTLREAKALKRQLEEERERGISSPDGQLTFGELWDLYAEQHLTTLAPSTRADYLSASKRLLSAYRLARVNSIDTAEVLRYREELLRTKSSATGRLLSPKRVRNILLVLASVYSWAVATGRARSNPVQGMRRAGRSQEPEERAVFLTQEEVGELLRSVKQVNPAYYPLFLLLAQTGMRLSESLVLEHPRDIDLVRRRIHITRSVFRGVAKRPKNGRSRTVGISDTLHEVLTEHLQGQEAGIVFPSRSGGYIDPNGLRRYVFDRAVEQSNLPEEKKARLKIHSLRHSAASHMVEQNIAVSTILELFGWSSPSLLLRYAHADADQAAAAGAAAVDDLR